MREKLASIGSKMQLTIISLKCIKRSDDGFQGADEPRIVVTANRSADQQTEVMFRPEGGDIKKGEKAGKFERLIVESKKGRIDVWQKHDSVRFRDAATIKLIESDHDKFGPHSADETFLQVIELNAVELPATTRRLTDGKDAEYELTYKVEPVLGGEIDLPDRDRPDIDLPDILPKRVSLNVLALRRGEDTGAGRRSDTTWLRLEVNGRPQLAVDGRRIDAGESALDRAFDVFVTSPMTLRLLEKSRMAEQYEEIASYSEAWSGAPDDLSVHNVDTTTTEGHRYTLSWQLTVR